MRTAKFIDIIKSFSGYLRVDNRAGYKEDYEFEDLGDLDFITKKIFSETVPTLLLAPYIYNIPAGSQTPIIFNFADDTVKFGAASPVELSYDLSTYRANPDIKFKLIIDANNSKPIGNEGWITNEEWSGGAYANLVELTLQPDTDTGLPGGLTLDNINVIIKA